MAASEADLATLRTFIASGGRFSVDAQGTPVAAPSGGAGSGSSGTTASGVSAADLRAQRQAINAQREADRQADRNARQAAQTQRAQQQADARRRAHEERNAKSARAPFDALSAWVEGLPTPGGNLALLLIILFFAFAIIPVNGGATRLELIYLVLTGRADLPTNAAGTSGNTTTTTPGIGQVIAGIGSGIGSSVGTVGTGIGIGVGVAGNALGLPSGWLPGNGGNSGGGPGNGSSAFEPLTETLTPARFSADW